jgi:hypothetical protein
LYSRTVLLVVLLGAAAAAHAPAAPEATAPVFRGERAMELLVAQCDLGPRPMGSENLEALRQLVAEHTAGLGLQLRRDCFTADHPMTGVATGVCNLVVSVGPAGGERLWLAAHYDTRPVADRDPDPERRDEPILGANDGASGVAVLLHLLELMAVQPPPRGVDIILFDAEDAGRPRDPASYCLGSQHLARTWQDMGSPLAGGEPRGLVLLDMVGERGARIPMERLSLVRAPAWTREVFDRAHRLGLSVFVHEPGPPVVDDHEPFLRVGIPAVNLIDFDYPQWHTLADTPEACSPESLRQVGELLVDLVFHP